MNKLSEYLLIHAELQKLATELRTKVEKLKTERGEEIQRARLERLCLWDGNLLRMIGGNGISMCLFFCIFFFSGVCWIGNIVIAFIKNAAVYNAGLSNAKPEEIEEFLACLNTRWTSVTDRSGGEVLETCDSNVKITPFCLLHVLALW